MDPFSVPIAFPRYASRRHLAIRGGRPMTGKAGRTMSFYNSPVAGLLNNLIAYWPGDEVAGNALDAHTNGLDLTDVNTVTSNPGQVYPLARQYTAATVERHTRPTEALITIGGNLDFTLMSWVRLDDKLAARSIICKYNLPGDKEYWMLYQGAPDRFRFLVSPDGAVTTSVDSDTFGAPSANTWYMVLAWHDATADKIYISVNNGAADNANHATGVTSNAADLIIGAAYAGANFPMNGRIGPSAMWKSAAGRGGVLTAAQRTALWNGGAGLTYAELTT